MNRSFSKNGVDPDLKMLLWPGSANLLSFVADALTPLGYRNVTDRFLVASGHPHLNDFRFKAMRSLYADFDLHFGRENFSRRDAGFQFGSTSSWIQMRVLANLLAELNPANITRQSVIDRATNGWMTMVDDLVFGPFSRNCSGREREGGFYCSCNEGYRATEVYRSTEARELVPAETLLAKSSFAECASIVPTVVPPLILLAVSDASRAAPVAAVLQATKAFANNMYERATVPVGGTAGETVSSAVENSIVSLVFPAFIDANAEIILATIDPIYFPAQLAPGYDRRRLHLVATLQQEIHALASAAVEAKKQCAAVVRAADAVRVAATVQESLNTFQSSLVFSRVFTELDTSLEFPPSTFDGWVFVIGLQQSADVAAVVQYLQRSPRATVLLAFSELSVLYDDLVSTAQAASVDDRVLFATSLVNWNLPASDIVSEYFATFPSAASRSPLSFRGFVVERAIHRITDQISPKLIDSEVFLKYLYSVAPVISPSPDMVMGPFSSASCGASADATCETNVGPRLVRTFALSDVVNATAANASAARPPFIFASGRVSYEPLRVDQPLLTPGALGGIAVGGAGFVALFLLLMRCVRKAGKRDNTHAPVDPSVPVTLIFTDIESSTSLWAMTPEAMAPALDAHHALIRSLIEKHVCYEVKTVGDAFMIATRNADSAIRLAVELQHLFFQQNWAREIDSAYLDLEMQRATEAGKEKDANLLCKIPEETYRSMWNGLRVRVGIHTGMVDIKLDPITQGVDYYGTAVNTAARVEAQANGGQVLVSQATLDAASPGLRATCVMEDIGQHELRGVPGQTHLFQISTVAGRKFRAGNAAVAGALEEAALQPSASSDSSPQKGSTDERTSSNEDTRKYRPARYKDPWASVVANLLVTLLSTLQRDRQTQFLQTLSERWRLNVAQARGAAPPRMLAEDLHLAALAVRLGTLMQHKYGPFPQTGNFADIVSQGSHSSGQL
jgi:adenylate cyclase